MTLLQGFATGLMTLGGLVALLNWLALFQTWRTGRFCSGIPLFGGLFLGVGMLLLPTLRPFAWLALVLDFSGTLMFLLFGLPVVVIEVWKTSRFNLLEEYAGQLGKKCVQLRLFRKGVFTLKRQFHRKPGELGLMGVSAIGTWEREGSRIMLSLYGNPVIFEVLPDTEHEAIRLQSGVCGYDNSELSLAGMELRLKTRRTTRR